jgi:NADPH:quinone reductase-like Zn-dependent oxidoreductase
MRAVVTESYGSGPALTELEAPRPDRGEIRVKVRSSSLNGFDIAVAGGYLKDAMEHRFPVVLGRDFAGTVDLVGDGVSEFAPGDEVFGVVLTPALSAGAFGEYVTLPATPTVARIPAGLDHARAGVLGLAGSAATASIEAVAPRAGETVLISGATGGVGAFAIQMAAARGVSVIATATGGTETQHVRGLGAAHAVDHTQDLSAQVRAIAPSGVDAVLHYAGDPYALAGLMRDGGRFASLLMLRPDQFGDAIPDARAVIAAPHRALLDTLAADVVAGRLAVPVQRTYTLDEIPKAFADFSGGTLGKLGVAVG